MRESVGYCRIRIAKDEAIRRFAAWNGVFQIGPLDSVTTDDPLQFARKQPGGWREVVFISTLGEWTLFNDLTGAFTLRPTAKWLELAGMDDLVFVAYNAGLEYAEVLALNRGAVVREFRWSADTPRKNINVGELVIPHEPFKSWVEVEKYADSDPLGFCNTGCVWRYDLRAEQNAAADQPRK